MDVNLNRIFSAEELSIDTSMILAKLRDAPEIVVFENNKPQFVIITLSEYKKQIYPPDFPIVDFNDPRRQKIGKLVQESFRRLMNNQSLPQTEINNLIKLEYANSIFKLNFPVLKEYNPDLSFDEQKRDAKGHNRYYSFTLSAYGKQYLLCSQWYEHKHRSWLEGWLRKWNM